MKQILIGNGSTIQFGLYTKGPFTPLPAKEPSKYSEYISYVYDEMCIHIAILK